MSSTSVSASASLARPLLLPLPHLPHKRLMIGSTPSCAVDIGKKKKVSTFFLCIPDESHSGLRPQASATPVDLLINRRLLQLNFISSQSTKKTKVYSACSHKMYHQMSRLHRMQSTKWKCYGAVAVPTPGVKTLNTLSLNFPGS